MAQPVKTQHHDKYPAIDPQGALKGSCSGKLVCILGASQGCGQAMAVSYAQAGAAQLFLTARAVASLDDTKQLVQAANSSTQVHAYSLDLKQPDLTQDTMQRVLQVKSTPAQCALKSQLTSDTHDFIATGISCYTLRYNAMPTSTSEKVWGPLRRIGQVPHPICTCDLEPIGKVALLVKCAAGCSVDEDISQGVLDSSLSGPSQCQVTNGPCWFSLAMTLQHMA